MRSKNTILIVDDLEVNRAILGNLFKKNYDIVEVSDGDEALEYLKKEEQNVVAILLDLIMPKVSGIEVLKTMKAENIGKDIPVFVITADNSEKVMYEAYELGVKDILEKPFVPYFLKKRIESVIELYKLKEEQKKLLEEMDYNFSNILKLSEDNKVEEIKELVKNLIEKK